MSDPKPNAHDLRVAVLTAAARPKSQRKADAAEQAIRALVKRGEPVTFQAVARQARVSHAFLYSHPDLRRRFEHLRGRHQPAAQPAAGNAGSHDAVVLTLTNQIEQLKKQHRQQVAELRAALEQAHGENLNLRRELARRGNHRHADAIETTS